MVWVTSRLFSKYQCNHRGWTRNKETKRVLKPYKDAQGYLRLNLKNNKGKRKTVYVHRLMGDTFLKDFDITDPDQTIDHIISQQRDNNNLHNLRIATRKQQNDNRTLPTRVPKSFHPIEQWTLDGQFVKRYESRSEAAATLGVSKNVRFGYKNGEPQEAYGFIWRYPEPGPDLDGELWGQSSAWVYVSNRGRMKMVINGQVVYGPVEGKQMAQGSQGYPTVAKKLLHLEVARLFLPPSPDPERTTINHKDGDKTNADVLNLERVTSAENAQHAHDTGLNTTSHPVVQMDLDGNVLARYPSAHAAARKVPKAHQSHITVCAQGKRKTCGGFRWKYAEGV